MTFQKGNKYAEGLTNSGRPPIYDDPEKLLKRITEYFDYIEGESHEEDVILDGNSFKQTVWDRKPEPATITGLCLFIGFSSKDTLYNYAKKPEFSDSIKRALTFIEKRYEESLTEKNPTGSIFALKNFGWKDVIHNENNVKSDTKIIVSSKDEEDEVRKLLDELKDE